MRSGDMLTRSKIKMEESIRQIRRQDVPYYNNEQDQSPSHLFKQSRESKHPIKISRNIYSESTPKYEGPKVNLFTRNDLLKQLRQEYDILKNLNVQDTYQINNKTRDQNERIRMQDESQLSNSIISKISSKVKQSEVKGLRQNLKNAEALHLQKKQLQIVIGNSMRKIEQLLNNEISLKKTIHDLKNQLDGKGGVHQEYEKMIKGFQKNEEQLQSELAGLKHQNQKSTQKIKDLTNKITSFQNDLSVKDKQLKQVFDEHKKYHELIRIEKDKYLNLQIKCKSLKMEFDMLQKQKVNDINRLVKQLENKESKQKEMNFTIKKLENDNRQKDRKYEELEKQKDSKRKEKDNEGEEKKTYLDELMYRSREINQNNKALADSVSMIYAKMAEIEKKNDVNLKKEIDAIKQKTDGNKKNTNESDLMVRVKELQKMIQRQVKEKNRLSEEIKNIKQRKYELQDRNRIIEKKFKELQQREEELKQQIEELEEFKRNYANVSNDHRGLKEQSNMYALKIKEFQQERESHRIFIDNLNASFKDKERRFQDEIRELKRKIDEATFQTEKIKRQGQLNLNIFKTTHEAETKRIIDQNARLSQKVKEAEASQNRVKGESENKFSSNSAQGSNIKNVIQILQKKYQQDLSRQKGFYEEKIGAIQNRHSLEMKGFKDKLISVSGSNEKLMNQLATYSGLDNQLMEMRKLLKQNRSLNLSIDHLWGIKEAEYQNISLILNTLKE